MPTGVQLASIAANAIVVIGAMGALLRFGWHKFQRVVQQSVTQPLNTLQTTVDGLKTDLVDVKESAKSAHDRLDRHLESHGSN